MSSGSHLPNSRSAASAERMPVPEREVSSVKLPGWYESKWCRYGMDEGARESRQKSEASWQRAGGREQRRRYPTARWVENL